MYMDRYRDSPFQIERHSVVRKWPRGEAGEKKQKLIGRLVVYGDRRVITDDEM